MSSEGGMSFQEHIAELRRRLTYSIIAVIVTTVIAFIFWEQITEILKRPAPEGTIFIQTEPTEALSASFRVSLIVGLFAAMPFILYQFVLFVSPGLNSAERRYLYALLPTGILVFGLGAAFGYFVLFPPAIHFLFDFGSEVAEAQIRIGSYLRLLISLLLWMGVVFETPLVLFFLSRIGIVTPQQLGRQRRYAIVVAFILGALITPTFDPINQTLVALPIIVLYEVGIWLSKIGARQRNRQRANEFS